MNRRTLPIAAPLLLAVGMSLAGSLTGCSVSWRSEYSRGSSTQSSGSEQPQPVAREPRRAPSGRDNVERVTVRTKPAPATAAAGAQPAPPQAVPAQPQAGAGHGISASDGRQYGRKPDAPAASGAAAGESGSPVPTPESTSPVVPPVATTPATPPPSSTPAASEPVVKTADKREGEPHYAPKRERERVKRSREGVEPKQNRNRNGTPATPVEPRIDRTR